MLQDWEAGLIGNNPGTTSRLPRKASPARAGFLLRPLIWTDRLSIWNMGNPIWKSCGTCPQQADYFQK